MTRLINSSLGQLVLAWLLLPLAVAGPVHTLNGDCDYTPTNDKGELGCCIVLRSRVSYCTWTPAGVRTGLKGPADLDYWMTTSMLLNPPLFWVYEGFRLIVDVQWRLSDLYVGRSLIGGKIIGEADAHDCSSDGIYTRMMHIEEHSTDMEPPEREDGRLVLTFGFIFFVFRFLENDRFVYSVMKDSVFAYKAALDSLGSQHLL